MAGVSRTGIRGLRRGKDGRYKIDLAWVDRNGAKQRHLERFPPGTPTGAARLRAQEVLSMSIAGTLTKRDEEIPVTFGAAFEKYLKWCAVNGRGDPKYKERHQAHWLASLGAGFALLAIAELAIEKHKLRRKEQGKGPGTINRELVTIKHFLNRCVDWGWLPKRPKVVLMQEPPPRVRWLTDTERTALAQELGKPQRESFRRVCNAALLSGQRLGKIIGLRKSEVDLEARTLTIADMAKGGVRRTAHLPISDALAVVLEEAMAASKGEHVFVAGRGGKPYTRSGASSFFSRVVEEAGIADLHFHDLRHDFATRVRRAGHGLDVVQALLAQATPTMTQRYAHIGSAQLQAAVAGIDAIRAPAPGEVPRKQAKKAVKSHRRQAS
jgi:integrase